MHRYIIFEESKQSDRISPYGRWCPSVILLKNQCHKTEDIHTHAACDTVFLMSWQNSKDSESLKQKLKGTTGYKGWVSQHEHSNKMTAPETERVLCLLKRSHMVKTGVRQLSHHPAKGSQTLLSFIYLHSKESYCHTYARKTRQENCTPQNKAYGAGIFLFSARSEWDSSTTNSLFPSSHSISFYTFST